MIRELEIGTIKKVLEGLVEVVETDIEKIGCRKCYYKAKCQRFYSCNRYTRKDKKNTYFKFYNNNETRGKNITNQVR